MTVKNKLIILLQSGANPNDTDDERLRKSSLLLMAILFVILSLLWGVIYLINGLVFSGLIPFSYGILSFFSVILFITTKKYTFFRFSQIILILILPFFLQLSLGGFIASSTVIIWALLSPLGALVFYRNPSISIKWFIAYTFIIVTAYVLNHYSSQNFKPKISDSLIITFFLMNVLGVSIMIFITQYYFVTQQLDLKRLVDEKNVQIEQKNKAIIDSINYAKRIQQAKLAKKEIIYSTLPDSFVLFKPKDIVSGDFYFFHKTDTSVFISSADCTGHGVPGALMSMIGLEKLNDALTHTLNTSEILSHLNKSIKSALRQNDSNESTRDGMDIALCSIDIKNFIVKYAGANRPIWIIPNGLTEVEEIKATNAAIGGLTENNQHFDTHEIKLQQGDTFYICTDGYADQFSGKTGKKLMTRKFKEILVSIPNKTMQEQEAYLDKFIEDWKAGTEQVDDILVIGVRL